MLRLSSLLPHYRLALSAAAAALVCTAPALAEEPAEHAPATPAAAAPAHAEEPDCEADHHEHPGEHAEHHGEHHGHHANHIAIFGGATTLFGDEAHTGATFGLDYERRLPMMDGLFGLGALVDVALMEHTSVIVAPALFIHPAGGLKITVAPGVEHEGEENVFVMRGGLSYAIHLGRLSVGPAVAADYANKHVALVYGLDIGMGF